MKATGLTGVLACLAIAACGGSPSSKSAVAPSALILPEPPASRADATGAIELAGCLQSSPSADAGCFSAARFSEGRITTAALTGAAAAADAPGNFTATASGTTVTLSWAPPAAGGQVLSYVIEAGTGPGLANLANFDTGSIGTSFIATGIGAGTYHVRIRARYAAGVGPSTDDVQLIVFPASGTLVFNPRLEHTAVIGQRFFWSFCKPDLPITNNNASLCQAGATDPSGGQPPYHFQFDTAGGFQPFGLSLGLNGILQGTPTAAGVRRFAVCAVDLAGHNVCPVVTVNVLPAACTPGGPTNVSATVLGTSVTVLWTKPADVCTPTSYVLEAGSRAGASDLASFNTGNTATSYLASGVGNGTYYVRVRAVNGTSQGPASTEYTLRVGTTAPPPPPSGTGGIISYTNTGGCTTHEYFDGWLNCRMDITVNVQKVVTSGYVSAFLGLGCSPGQACGSFYHGEVRVTPGTRPGIITISTKNEFIKAGCLDGTPTVTTIYDGPQGAGSATMLYTSTGAWRGAC
jgi:hypothetical protein